MDTNASMTKIQSIVAVLVTLLSVSFVQAKAFVPNLPPGSTYHLAFVTDRMRDATSDQIAVYDTFVNTDAETNDDLAEIAWVALGQTLTSLSARDRLSVSGPVFTLAGERVANDAEEFFSGLHQTRISITPAGEQLTDNPLAVWTGSDEAGTTPTCWVASGQGICPLGHPIGYQNTVWDMSTSASSSTFVSYSNRFWLEEVRLIAVSEPRLVPIPEPSSFHLLLLGPALVWRWRQR